MTTITKNKYDWVLFDADETLFHYPAFDGLALMLSRHGITFTKDDFALYQQSNVPLWKAYQDGEVDAYTLKTRRFESWSQKLNCPEIELNTQYMLAMAELSKPIDGAQTLLTHLKNNSVKMGIITNGFTQLQQPRLQQTGFSHYFDCLVVSEEVGFAKPDVRIFEHTFAQIEAVDKSRILMVGDNPHSDILGGINSGVDTCWLNVNKEEVNGIKPTYDVQSLAELTAILS